MSFQPPRLFRALQKTQKSLSRRSKSFFTFFARAAGSLLFGLLGGSLRGTFLDWPRSAGWWDGSLRAFLILGAEVRTLRYHSSRGKSTLLSFQTKQNSVRQTARLPLQFVKRGGLFALFRDAFKVGSLEFQTGFESQRKGKVSIPFSFLRK